MPLALDERGPVGLRVGDRLPASSRSSTRRSSSPRSSRDRRSVVCRRWPDAGGRAAGVEAATARGAARSGSRARRARGRAARRRGRDLDAGRPPLHARRRARRASPTSRRRARPSCHRRPGERARPRCSSRCSRTTARRAVILTKRPETMPSHRGEIAFPGGKREPERRRPRAPRRCARRTRRSGSSPPRSRSSPSSTASAPSRRSSRSRPFVGLLAGRPELRPDPARGRATRSRSRSRSCSHPDAYREERWDLCGAPAADGLLRAARRDGLGRDRPDPHPASSTLLIGSAQDGRVGDVTPAD